MNVAEEPAQDNVYQLRGHKLQQEHHDKHTARADADGDVGELGEGTKERGCPPPCPSDAWSDVWRVVLLEGHRRSPSWGGLGREGPGM